MPLVKPSVPKEYWALAALLLLAVFVASPGLFTIDEAIYYLGARAVAEQGTLGLDNTGYEQLHSESLKLRFLIDGPQGLTPQYPAGSALIAAPLLGLLGPRAFMLLNALAAIGMIFTVRNICLSQFRSERVARIAIALMVFGTFWLEYAVGVWPHMLSSYFAVQAYWFALRHLDSGGKGYRDAMLSGLFAGAGILFRLDAALVVPAIGLLLVLFAPQFLRSSAAFGAAVLPSVFLGSCLSYLKFGTLNPFSYGRTYGQSGGNADLSAHLPLLAALCVGAAALLFFRVTKLRLDRKAAIASVILVGAVLLVVPATSDFIVRLLRGFWSLFVDIRTIDDPRLGVKEGPGGTLLFWTLVKKSLGQSMPWIGVIAMLLTGGIEQNERRLAATTLVFITVMTLPYVLLSWHGGGGGNMRYFLPVLPTVAIVGAMTIVRVWQAEPSAISCAAIGVWTAVISGLAWTFLHPSGYAGVQQILSSYLLIATAVAGIAAGLSWRFREAGRQLVIVLFSAGLVVAATSAASDFQVTEKRRMMSYGIAVTVGGLPPHSLAITFPEWAALKMPGNNSIIASREPEYQRPDHALMTHALSLGYRIYITSFEFDVTRDVPVGLEIVATDHLFPGGRMLELRRMSRVSTQTNPSSSR